MRKSSLQQLLVISSASCLCYILYKYSGLILSLPLLVCGISLFFVFALVKDKSSFVVLIGLNLGSLLAIIGALFTFANMTASDKKSSVVYEGDYGSKGSWLTGKQADGLGYKYKPGLGAHRSRKILLEPNGEKRQIYNVIYTIDNLGNRQTPYKGRYNLNRKTVVFLGDSLTFGEGLNDDETLPYFFQTLSGFQSFNLGMHGYGTHQPLKMLESSGILEYRINRKNPDIYIYRMIMNHINRSAGYSPWDRFGPCYEVMDGSVQYVGTFAECKESTNLSKSIQEKLLSIAHSSKEPFTRYLFDLLWKNDLYANTNYHSEDVDRLVYMVNKMNQYVHNLGANFVVILEDANTSKTEICGKNQKMSQTIASRLIDLNISILKTSDIYTSKMCRSGDLVIDMQDSHPSSFANKILADRLFNYIKDAGWISQ